MDKNVITENKVKENMILTKNIKRKKSKKNKIKNKMTSNPPKKKRNFINLNIENKENIINFGNLLNLGNQPQEINLYSKDKIGDKNKLKSFKTEYIINKVRSIMKYKDDELNDLEYDLALRFDTRNYCHYYISLLKSKHDILFTFINDDYNSKLIKIDLFFFNISLFFASNTLFFDDETMHEIYKDKGNFDFIYQLPQIIYSTLLSMFFDFLSEKLPLSQELISDFKNDKNKDDLNIRIISLNKKIKIRFIIYFIISTIFLLCFWYYVSIFCAVYSNTQSHLIKDTLISFVMSLITPFGYQLIPGLCRIPALSSSQNKRICLYKISKIIQFF